MLNSATMPYRSFRTESRFDPVYAPGQNVRAAELLTLVAAGMLGALAIAFMPLPIRVPGHAILKAALPMVAGVALVPRRYSGTIAGFAAGGTVAILLAMGLGRFQTGAVTALLAIGPAIDLATTRVTPGGWRLYFRFGAAGVIANLAAFAVRWGTSWFGIDGARPHTIAQFGIGVLISFAACGLVAGLVSALVCFRASSRRSEEHAW